MTKAGVLLLFLCCLCKTSFAQSAFTFKIPSGLSVCTDTALLQLKVTNTSSSDTLKSAKITYRMPAGYRYLKSSVTGTGVSESNITKSNAPVFSVPNLKPGDSVKLTIKVIADCDIITFINNGGTLKNLARLDHSRGSDSSASSAFSLDVPTLTISKITNQSYVGAPGDTFSRHITFTNTAVGKISGFTFYIVRSKDVKIDSIKGKIPVISGDTLKIFLNDKDFKKIGNKDNFLDKGETVVLQEYLTIKGCANLGEKLIVAWGCNKKICETYSTTASVVISQVYPDLSVVPSYSQSACLNKYVDNKQKITIKNNGTGAAYNVAIDIFQTINYPGGYYDTVQSRIDEKSIKIKYGTGTATGTNADSLIKTTPKSCLSYTNPIGRFIKKIPLIKAGETIEISWDVYNCCAVSGYVNTWGYKVDYTEQCKSKNYTTGLQGANYRRYQSFSDHNANTADLIVNDTVNYALLSSGYNELFPQGNKARLVYEVTFPAGVTVKASDIRLTHYTGSPAWKAGSAVVSGSKVTLTYTYPPPSGFNLSNSYLDMNLGLDTTGGKGKCGDVKKITLKVKYTADDSCTSCTQTLLLDTFTVKFNCNNPKRVGLQNLSVKIERTSLGLPDNNDDGKPDASGSINLTKIATDRVMYGDTFKVDFKGIVRVKGVPSIFHHGIADIKFSEDYFKPIGFEVRIVDSANAKTYTCDKMPYYEKNGSNYRFFFHYDSLKTRGCSTTIASGYRYRSGDSIQIKILYKVIVNNYGIKKVNVNNTFFFGANPNPTKLKDYYYIDNFPGSINVVGYYHTTYSYSTGTHYGCKTVDFSQSFYLSIGPCCSNYYGGNMFPYEYRNWSHAKAFKTLLPKGYEYVSAKIYYYPTEGSGKYGVYTSSVQLREKNGDTLVFNIDSLYKAGGGNWYFSDDGYAGTMIVTAKASCESISNVTNRIWQTQTYEQDSKLSGTQDVTLTNYTNVTWERPSLSIQPALQSVNTLTDTFSWTVYLSNSHNSADIDKAWLAFESGNGNIEINSVSTTGGSNYNESKGIFKLDALKGGGTKIVKINARINSCSKDSIKLIMGWDCNDYPDSLNGNTCPTDTLILYAEPKQPAVQIRTIAAPDSIYLCDTAKYTLQITNTKTGYAKESEVDVVLIPGLKIAKGASYLEYPIGSKPVKIADPDSINPYLFRFSATEISGKIDSFGLPGVSDTLYNAFRLHTGLITDCDYISGSFIEFTANSFDNCGQPVNLSTTVTPALYLYGATAPYLSLVTIRSKAINACGNGSELIIKVLNMGNGSTDSTDNIFITLPKGLSLDKNYFKQRKNAPNDSSREEITFNGQTRISWIIPQGVVSGDSVVFAVWLKPDSSIACSRAPVFLQSTTKKALTCITTNTTCLVKVETGRLLQSIDIKKPQIALDQFSAFSKNNTSGGEEVTLKIRIKNNGDTLKPGKGQVIRFYLDTDGNKKLSSADFAVSTDTIKSKINPNGTININKTYNIPAGKNCALIAYWDSTGTNCACSPTQTYLDKIPMLNAGKDTSVCYNQSIIIGEDSIKGFKYQWWPGNLVADSTKSITTFAGKNTGSNIITQKLVLTTIRTGNCTVKDTLTLISYPEFKIDPGAEKTICWGGTANLGGSPSAKGGSGNFTYIWSPKNGLTNSAIANPKASPLQTTWYKLTVIQNGCAKTDSVKVEILPIPVADAGTDKTICEGDNVTLGGTTVASGGKSPYTYAWNPTSGLSSSTSAYPKANPVSTTSYILTVTDAKGCKGYDTVTVNVNKNPVANAGNDAGICAGDSIKIGASASASGGISPYIYIWDPSTGLSDSSVSNPYAKPTITTTYILTVIDAKGCKDTSKVKITVNSLPLADAGTNREICSGDTTTLGGNPTANGGSGTFTYMWSPKNALSSETVANPKTYTKTTTTYKLKITDAKGCFVWDSVKITVNQLPVIEAGKNDTICETDTLKLSAIASANYTYAWSPGKWMKDSTVLNPYIYPAKNTSFILTAKDAKGCIQKDTINIFVRSRKALAPPVLKCVNALDTNKIEIKWDTVSNNIEFAEYRLYRINALGKTIRLTSINSSKITTYTDISINDANSTQYRYFLSVINKCQVEGTNSDTIGTIILTAVKHGDKTLNFSWTAPYKGKMKYALEYNSGNGYKTLDTIYKTNYQLRSCNQNASYRIKVGLNNSCNIYSNQTPKIELKDTTAPRLNILVFATVKNWKEIELQFTASDSTDTKSYKIFRAENGGNFSQIATVKHTGNLISYTDGNLETDKNFYSYKIYSEDTCGNISTFTKSHTPVLLKAKAGNYEAQLSWNNYEGFIVKRQELQRLENGTWSTIKSFTSLDSNYIDKPLTCAVTQYYRILSISTDSSVFSMSDSVIVTPFDTVKPAVPVVKFVSVNPNVSVKLSWNKVTDIDVKNYIIYRKSKNANSWQTIDTVVNIDNYTDSVPDLKDSIYNYAVSALDSCVGNISQKSIHHNTIVLDAKIIGCEQAAYLNWNTYNNWKNGVNQYKIYRSEDNANEILRDSTTQTSWKDTSVDFHHTFTYRIEAEHKNGAEISSSNIDSIRTIDPGTPEIFYATKLNSSANAGNMLLKWDVKNPSRYASYRKLFYRTNKDSAYKILANNLTLKQDTFLHTGINTRVGYHDYFMLMVDSCGNLSDSSANHTPIDLTVKVGQLIHDLHWSPYKGWSKNTYIVQKWDGNSFYDLDTIPGNDTVLRKFPAPCNNDIFYRIKALSPDGYISYSDTMGGRAIDTIPANAVSMKNVSVLSGNTIKIDFTGADSLDIYAYAIQRGENGSWTTAGQILYTKPQDNHVFTDTVSTWKNQVCYTVITLDSCLNATASDTFCTIQLLGLEKNLSNQLNWQPFVGYEIDTYKVEYLTQNGWDILATVNGTDSSYFHTPLPCNVPVSYRIEGIENGGFVTYSDTITLTPYDTIKPQAPVLDYISVLDKNSFETYWQFSSDKDVKLYELQVKSLNGNWVKIDTLDRINTYIVSGKNTLDSTYLFRVVAIDSCADNRSQPSIAHKTIQLKGKPENLATNLFWNSYEGFQVKNYVIYTWQNNGWRSLDTIGGNKQSYTDTGLACNVPVTYKVSALAANGGFVSYSDSITITPFDTIKPKSPVLKYASVLPDRSIKLAWEWNTKSDVKYFEIWRNKDNGNWQKMSTVVYDSLYIDTQVSPQNSSYKYYVIAIDSCNILNRSMPSDTDRIINLNLATGGCIPYVNLSWTKYAELPVNVNQYEIQRSTDGINYTMAGTTNANVTNFRDTLVKADVGYFYKIKAVDFESGYSSYSDSSYTIPWIYPLADSTQIVFTTVQKTGETDGEIRVKWRKYDFNKDTFARGYNLYRSTSPTLPFKKIYTTFQPNDTTYIDALKNTSDSLHFYYVSVYNSCNIDGPKSIVHQPVNLNIENRNLEAVLRWNTYKGAAVNYYEIYKSDNKNPYRKIAVLNSVDSVYSDTNILCKQVYKYQVFAYLQNGNISVSDIESITSFDTIPPVKPDIQAVSVDVSHLRFGQVSVKFTGNNEPNRSGYRIFSKDINGNFNLAGENFDLQKDTINWTITPVNTSLSPFTYFVTAFDSCGNISTPSDTHTTVFLQAKAYSMFIQLDWTNYIGFKKNYNYKIQRRKTNEPWMEIANVSSTVLSLRDSSAECNVYYAYRILTEEDLSGAFSYSNIAGDTAFETEQPMAPVIKYVSVISPNNIEINWKSSLSSDAAAYHIYRSEDNGATWNQIAYNVNDTAYIDAGINTYNTVYQYKIETLDKCGNLSADFSAPHGSIKLRATAGNEKVDINWNAYFGWLPDGYKLYRDGNLLATLSGNTLAYIDTNVLCINSYSYKVMAYKLDTDSLISWSNPDSARPFDTNKPQKVYLKYATVSMPNKQVSLNWEASKSRDAKEYRIMRRNGNTGFYELAGITNATTFTDSFENISNAHCYYIETYDYCGNRSEWSNPGCIIVLSGESKPGKNILSWNAYSQWNKNISHYNIYRNDDSTGWRNINAANNTVYEDIAFADTSIQNFCYKVEAVESGTNINSFSTVTCLQQEPIVYIPNAFTPDLADGINDKFRPEGLYIKSFKISIYNRWGQLVYENNNAEGWNGKYRGKYAPTDIYLYKIIVESYSGVESFFNGTVILLR